MRTEFSIADGILNSFNESIGKIVATVYLTQRKYPKNTPILDRYQYK